MSVRMRRKKNLQPRLEVCSPLMIPDAAGLKGRWREVLHTEKLWLEIGCGKGKFTVETALENPDAGLVALERVPEAIVMAAEKAVAAKAENVRYTIGDAANLADFFAEGELDRIYINFCDPWRKTRHAKRRLIYRDFLKLYAALLSPAGEIHFKTDNRPLFDFALEEVAESPFQATQVCYDLAASGLPNITTEYEEKFMSFGTPINRMVYVKSADKV